MVEELRCLTEKFKALSVAVLTRMGYDLITLKGYDERGAHVETVSTLLSYPHPLPAEELVARYMPKGDKVVVESVRGTSWLVLKGTCCTACGHSNTLRCTRCNLS